MGRRQRCVGGVCGRRVREACAGGGIGGGRCAGERARLQHCSFLVRLLYLALLRGLGHLARRPRRLLELGHLEVTCAQLRLQLAHRVHARRQPLRRRRHRLLGDGGAAPLGRQLLLPLRQLKGEAGMWAQKRGRQECGAAAGRTPATPWRAAATKPSRRRARERRRPPAPREGRARWTPSAARPPSAAPPPPPPATTRAGAHPGARASRPSASCGGAAPPR